MQKKLTESPEDDLIPRPVTLANKRTERLTEIGHNYSSFLDKKANQKTADQLAWSERHGRAMRTK